MWLEIYAHLKEIGMPQIEGVSAVERCKRFVDGLVGKIKELSDEVFELNVCTNGLRSALKENDEKIERLESEIEDLEDDARMDTLIDQEKYDLFTENFDKISLSQLEGFFREL